MKRQSTKDFQGSETTVCDNSNSGYKPHICQTYSRHDTKGWGMWELYFLLKFAVNLKVLYKMRLIYYYIRHHLYLGKDMENWNPHILLENINGMATLQDPLSIS